MSGFKDSPSAFRDLGGLATRAEEELHRRNLLDVVLNPKVKVKTAVLPAYDQQLLVSKEECLQEDSGPPHIKEEQEELWSSPEKEELQGLKEADTTKFPFKIVIVKSEDDEERPCPHSFMRDKVKRWKQELIERAVEEQNQLIEFN
ncbi:uncharacterized protein LOC121521457 isoform X2 [Cheilinus undulatus]|uniref:uncharacterized protein LOC121521457 isoform X2 n=1 Tax=Cheilinus undulatus TaxID=241271 RepID=UPI001BD66E84|nr:uncharacterized protein LOC121521457 isoform X2 [Cheilinus undulatus]